MGDVGESAGGAAVHAAGGDVGEDFAENEVDADGMVEFGAEGQEFRADGFGGFELLESAVVEEAEFAGGLVSEHAAAATVGELVVAARTAALARRVCGCGAGFFVG